LTKNARFATLVNEVQKEPQLHLSQKEDYVKKMFICGVAVAAALALSSCGTLRTPAAIDMRTGPYGAVVGTGGDFTITPDGNVGTKQGESSSTAYLWGLWAVGDDSIAKAAQNGNITRIGTVSQKQVGIFGIYNKTTTIVTGE
jgi:hypothetical protein